jgi:hypothetical protein
MNNYPKQQLKKFWTKKLVEMDEYATSTLLQRIEEDENIEYL